MLIKSLETMADQSVVDKLVKSLLHSSSADQAAALENIRDLASEPAYREAFCQAGLLEPLVGLVSGKSESTLPALQAIQALSAAEHIRNDIVKAGAVGNLVGLLQDKNSPHSDELLVGLQALLILSSDEAGRHALTADNGIPAIVHLLDASPTEEITELACELLGRLGLTASNKDVVRENRGILYMIKLLRQSASNLKLTQTILQALTILVMENEVNQDQVADQFGMEPLLQLLDPRVSGPLAVAATTCLTGLCLNNEQVKNMAREHWALPLLVNNLDNKDVELVERSVECLRVLTIVNQFNKLALFSIPAAVQRLVQLMISSQSPTLVERSAAVLGNLSQTEQFFGAIRERGGLPRLVQLLDSGPQEKITEIAAKILANLTKDENNKKSIRLAGGVPPLVNLLTQGATFEVLMACEAALKSLEVSNAERNAVLETLRYCDQQRLLQQTQQQQPLLQNGHPADLTPAKRNLPLTQYGVEETCALLSHLGIQDVATFRENGVTGGDLLDLSPSDLEENLKLTPLQARKISNIKACFKTYEGIGASRGKGEITTLELREWLQKQGLSAKDQQAVVEGFKQAKNSPNLAILSFRDFAVQYQWLCKILEGSRTSEPTA